MLLHPNSFTMTNIHVLVSIEDSCRLFCQIENHNVYYELASKVIDGTPCRKGSFDVCVEGRCRVCFLTYSSLFLFPYFLTFHDFANFKFASAHLIFNTSLSVICLTITHLFCFVFSQQDVIEF